MACIVRQKVGNNVYVYESVSYRNAEGKAQSRRVLIGKIDAATGQPVYKPEYVARMAAAGVTVEGATSLATFTADEIRRSTVLEFGTMYLLQHSGADRPSGSAATRGTQPICRDLDTGLLPRHHR